MFTSSRQGAAHNTPSRSSPAAMQCAVPVEPHWRTVVPWPGYLALTQHLQTNISRSAPVCGLINDAFSQQYYTASNGRATNTNESRRMRMELVVANLGHTHQHVAWKTEENDENSVNNVDDPVDIQNGHILNTSHCVTIGTTLLSGSSFFASTHSTCLS